MPVKTKVKYLDDGRVCISFAVDKGNSIFVKMPLESAIEMLSDLYWELQGIKTLSEQELCDDS